MQSTLSRRLPLSPTYSRHPLPPLECSLLLFALFIDLVGDALQKSRVQVWLYEQTALRLEGRIVVRGCGRWHAVACVQPWQALGVHPAPVSLLHQ